MVFLGVLALLPVLGARAAESRCHTSGDATCVAPAAKDHLLMQLASAAVSEHQTRGVCDVNACFARCEKKFGGKVVDPKTNTWENRAYMCGKGCASLEDKQVEDPEKFCKIDTVQQRELTCLAGCSKASSHFANQDACKYGCEFWTADVQPEGSGLPPPAPAAPAVPASLHGAGCMYFPNDPDIVEKVRGKATCGTIPAADGKAVCSCLSARALNQVSDVLDKGKPGGKTRVKKQVKKDKRRGAKGDFDQGGKVGGYFFINPGESCEAKCAARGSQCHLEALQVLEDISKCEAALGGLRDLSKSEENKAAHEESKAPGKDEAPGAK